MRRIQTLIFLIFIAISSLTRAQDSTTVLSYEDFITQVMEYHPLAFRADIIQSAGESGVLQARGAFDPKLFGNASQKYFEDKQYYSHITGGLKIPTWFGISGEAGYMLNDGLYLNPEQRVPNAGLWYAGIRLELGNGLIIDQRRAEFEKAKLNRASSELERKIALNELRRNASIAYWKWQQTYNEVRVYEMAFRNASERYQAVKDAAIFGDRPKIDTVEALMSVQNREISLRKAQTSYDNATLKLEMFLWTDGVIPLEVDNAVPAKSDPESMILASEVMDSLVTNHPYLQIIDLELQQRQVDLQLKREQLKPQLTLKYNAINEPVNNNPLTDYSPANYTWGATFSYPILTRKERGGVQLANLKLEDQKLKNAMSAVELDYKINSTLNNFNLALQQMILSEQLVTNNETMYNAETTLFGLGESSVFMINSRENSWIKSQVEYIQSVSYYQMALSDLNFQLMRY